MLRELSGRVWLVCALNGLLGFAFNGFAELFPLWAKSDVEGDAWGLGFDALEIGVAHAISGPVAAAYQIFGYRKFVDKVGGVVNALRLKQILLLVLTLLFPLQHLLAVNTVSCGSLKFEFRLISLIFFCYYYR